MAILGDPDYKKLKRLSEIDLGLMNDDDILYSYIIIKTDFEFKSTVKYPSIPCFVDNNTTVYPLKGSAFLTGSEYILARNIGCAFDIKDIYLIPFKAKTEDKTEDIKNNSNSNSNSKLEYQPFKDCIKDLQSLRREYPKTHVYNLIYKGIANSIYGLVTRGISNKTKHDFRTKTNVRMKGNELSNPMISSWITAYIRSVIGELLNNIHLQGGFAVSTTTDGFITNIPDLEDSILENKSLNSYLLKSYRNIRKELNGVEIGLELKHTGENILS